MLASRHFPSFGWYDDVPSPAEPTGVDQLEAWFDDTAVRVPSIAAAVFWIHRRTTPRYSVSSASSIFREQNDLPTRAARIIRFEQVIIIIVIQSQNPKNSTIHADIDDADLNPIVEVFQPNVRPNLVYSAESSNICVGTNRLPRNKLGELV